MPALTDPVLDLLLPRYTITLGRHIIVLIYWLSSIFGSFLLIAIFISRIELLSKPIKADVRTTPVEGTEEQIKVFTQPEEDYVYAGMRYSNSVLTCRNSANSPLSQGLGGVLLALAYWVLVICMTVTTSIEISRNISTKDVTDIALKSHVDGNLICADARFSSYLTDSPLANEDAFTFKENINDVLFYSFLPRAAANFKKCSDVLVY